MGEKVHVEARDYQLFVGGEWCDAEDGATFETRCPGDGKRVATVAKAGAADVDKAVAVAKELFDAGEYASKDSAPERAALLRQVSQMIKDKVEDFAALESFDTGKTITETSLIDVHLAADTFAFYANLATQIYSEVMPVPGRCWDFTLKEPVGVVGAIVPWNFPLLFTSWKIAPAVAAGCPIVYKPSEEAPCTSMEVAKLFDICGAPPGSLSVLPGYGADCGARIVNHPDIAKLTFTGGNATGKLILKSAADTLKQTTLELGGKSPNIVFDDADLDKAVSGALNAAFLNQGEICCGGSRLLLQEGIHDQFVERLVARAKKIQVGHPLDWESRMGPMISQKHLEKVLSYIQIGKKEAKLACGGKRLTGKGFDKGYYVEPTIFVDCDNKSRICQEEIFGPVLSVIKFSDEDEAVAIANDTIYGLAAGLWTQCMRRALRLPPKLRAGSIWVNQYNMITPYTPFGGYKQSGFGRDLSKYALDSYLQIKNIYVDASEDLLTFYE